MHANPSANLRKYWTDKEPLECVSIVPEAPNTASFAFRAPSGNFFDFKQGQFLTFELPVPGNTVYRTYSISSSPTRPRLLTITAKAQADSIGTRWMLDHLKPGMQLKATGPAGNFSNADSRSDKFLFISAGTGITPMMSMVTSLWDEGRKLDAVFINCAHRPTEIIFKQRLEEMASREPGLDLKFVVSEPDPFRVWTGYQGKFNQLMLGLMAPDYLDREVYCCGPQSFMQAVRETLASLGHDMENDYFQESFSSVQDNDTDATAQSILGDSSGETEVHFATSNRRQGCSQQDSVLAIAKEAGIMIPSGCCMGVCGTCRVKKLSGEVQMVHNGGITEQDIKDGFILACCSQPRGRVSIDI